MDTLTIVLIALAALGIGVVLAWVEVRLDRWRERRRINREIGRRD